MKWLLAIIFSISSIIVLAQSDDKKTERIQVIDEVSVSFNYTTFRDSRILNSWGFGGGVYKSFFRNKRVALNVGFEFNRTSQFKKWIYESHFSRKENVTLNINNFSIPISARCQFGKKNCLLHRNRCFCRLTNCSDSERNELFLCPWWKQPNRLYCTRISW